MKATAARKQVDELAAAIRGVGPVKRTPAEIATDQKLDIRPEPEG